MKLSVSTYSFGNYINKDALGIFGVMDKAKELGFKGIEICESEEIGTEIETALKIRDYSEKIGLPIVCYDVGADFISRDNEVKRICSCVDFAAALGSPKMRHDAWYGGSPLNADATFEEVLPKLVESISTVTEYAKSKNVMTLTENHGIHIQASDKVVKLIEKVNNENYRALVDIGNFLCVDEDNLSAIKNVIKYAAHVHVKDFYRKSKNEVIPDNGWFPTSHENYLRGAIVGHGILDIPKSLEIVKNSGYNGYVTLEFEGLEDNLTGIALGKKFIDNIINSYEE